MAGGGVTGQRGGLGVVGGGTSPEETEKAAFKINTVTHAFLPVKSRRTMRTSSKRTGRTRRTEVKKGEGGNTHQLDAECRKVATGE